MLDGESTIWINMEGNWHYEIDFKEHEGSGIYKQGPEHQEAHMESLLPSTQIIVKSPRFHKKSRRGGYFLKLINGSIFPTHK